MHQWGLRSLTWTYHSSQASGAWPSTPLLGPEHPVSPRPSAWACVWAFPLCLTWKIHIHQSVLGLKPCRSANEVCYQGCLCCFEKREKGNMCLYIYIYIKKTLPFLGSKSQNSSMALHNSTCGKVKHRGSAKSFYLVTFYWWFSFKKEKKKVHFYNEQQRNNSLKNLFIFFLTAGIFFLSKFTQNISAPNYFEIHKNGKRV